MRTRSRKKAKRGEQTAEAHPVLKSGEAPGPQTHTDSSLSAPGSLAVRKRSPLENESTKINICGIHL